MPVLTIKQDNCELNFLALGSPVHRLDPGTTPLRPTLEGYDLGCRRHLSQPLYL